MNKLARLMLALLVAFGALFAAACPSNTPQVNNTQQAPFSGAPDRTSVEMADTSEARATVGTIQTALKGMLLTRYEGNVDKLAAAVSGQLTDNRAQQLFGGTFNGNTYKTTDYSLTHLGGGKFKVTVAPGTRKEVVQEISAK